MRQLGKQALTVFRPPRWRWKETSLEDAPETRLTKKTALATTTHAATNTKTAEPPASAAAALATTERAAAAATLPAGSAAAASRGADALFGRPWCGAEPQSSAMYCQCCAACNRKGIHKYWKSEGKRFQRCTQAPAVNAKFCEDCKCFNTGCSGARHKSDFCIKCKKSPAFSPTSALHTLVSKVARFMPLPTDIAAFIKHVNIRENPPAVAIIAARLWETWAVEACVKGCGGEASPAALKKGLLSAIAAAKQDMVGTLGAEKEYLVAAAKPHVARTFLRRVHRHFGRRVGTCPLGWGSQCCWQHQALIPI